MVPRGFPSNKWTFGQDFTVYEPITDTFCFNYVNYFGGIINVGEDKKINIKKKIEKFKRL